MLPTLDSLPIHDREACMELLDGDEELLTELVGLFAENVPETLEAIRRSLETQDLDGIAHAAHSLKGSSANLGAERIRRLASELEIAAREQHAEDFAAYLAALHQELTAFLRETGA